MRSVPLATAVVAVAATLAGMTAGCSSDDAPAHQTPPEVLAPDSTTFQVTWKPTTRVLDEAAVKAALLSSSPSTGEVTFKSGAAAIDGLKTGDVAVLPGVGLFKIVSNSEAGATRVLKTELAALTDAIAEGTIAWSLGFHGQNLSKLVGVGDKGKLDSVFTNGALTYSGKLSGWDVTFTLTPQGDDFGLTMSATYDKSPAVIKLAGTGTLRGFRDEANLIIQGGSITSFTLAHKHLEADLTLEIGGVELGGDASIKVPARIAIPFTLGPLPAFTSVGGTFEVSSTLKANTSNIAKLKFHLLGAAGLKLDGGSIVPIGQLDDKSVTYESGSAAGTITAGLGMLLHFPEVDFGVGVPGTEASVFFKIKNEIVSNFELHYTTAGPYPVIDGNCLTVGGNLGGYVGGTMKVFNFTLAKSELPVFTSVNPLVKKGDKCD